MTDLANRDTVSPVRYFLCFVCKQEIFDKFAAKFPQCKENLDFLLGKASELNQALILCFMSG